MPQDTYLLSILERALDADYGVEVQAGSPKTFQNYCFAARRRYKEQTGDERYECLTIRLSPDDPENLVIIVKKEPVDKIRMAMKEGRNEDG